MGFEKLTALELGHMIRQGKIKVKEALDFVFADSNAVSSPYAAVCKESAYAHGEEIQRKIDRDHCDFLMAGVPFIVNDNISVKGIQSECGSKILQDYKPVFDATSVQRLTEAGGIIAGKAKMSEFSIGGYKEELHCQQDGIFQAVSKGNAFYGLGTDLGIDAKQKACEYGLTLIKPTAGAVSRHGLISTASSLEQIAPIGKNVLDCAYALAEISGNDKKDGTTIIKEQFNFKTALKEGVKGLKIVIPKEFTNSNASEKVKRSIKDTALLFEKQGALILETEIFNTPEYGNLIDYILPSYYILLCAELNGGLSKYDGIKYGCSAKTENLLEKYFSARTAGFGEEIKEKILLGALVLSKDYFNTYYKKAMGVRQLLKTALDNIFDRYDIILSPVSLGMKGNSEDKAKENLLYAVISNMYGGPAISFPSSSKEDKPKGIQMIGKPFSEAALVKTALNYQINTGLQKPATQGRCK